MIKKYLNIALAVFVLGGWGGLFKPDPVNIYAEPRALPQREMFRFAENGEAYKLNDFKDQFVIANFWSRYCSPCLRELDNLNNFSKKVADNGIKVVIISPASEWHSLEEQQKFCRNTVRRIWTFTLTRKVTFPPTWEFLPRRTRF